MRCLLAVLAVTIYPALVHNASAGLRCDKDEITSVVGIADRFAKFHFEIRNDGDKAFKLVKCFPSCGCTDVKVSGETVEPNGNTHVDVTIDLGMHFGRLTKTVLVTTDDTEHPKILLVCRIDCPEPFTLQPVLVTWAVGQTGFQDVHLKATKENKDVHLTHVSSSAGARTDLTPDANGHDYTLRIYRDNPESVQASVIHIQSDQKAGGLIKEIEIMQVMK